jgi:outer membrane lipoprotein SlyB
MRLALDRLRLRRAIVACALLLPLCGCVTKKPVLYPNPHLEAVGRKAAEREVDECQSAARDFQPDDAGREAAAADAAANTGAGAAAGAVGGAIGGRGAGVGAAIGAATAATFHLVRSMFRRRDPDPVRKRFVERCLADRGYEVAGWR